MGLLVVCVILVFVFDLNVELAQVPQLRSKFNKFTLI